MAGQQDPPPQLSGRPASVPGSRLARGRLAADVLEVAPALLGRVLVCDRPEGRVAVRLTEVEAYRGEGEDPGSHAYRGRTPRTEVMFGPPGHLYVYFSYGMHWCANVVCGRDGAASAVLLRAGEVVLGHELARARRPSARTDTELARGPARLTVALGIGPQDDGADLCVPEAAVWLAAGNRTARREGPPVSSGPRVGVAGPGGDADAFPWRFWLTGDRTVSAYRPGKSPRRASAGPD